MSRLRESIERIKQILEDATCASLAPYPVPVIGTVVKVTNKEAESAKKKKHNNRSV